VDLINFKAVSFTLNGPQNATLDNIVVGLDGVGLSNYTIAFRLLQNTLGQPGALIGSIGTANITGGSAAQAVTLTPGSTLNLSAGTTYWIEALATSGTGHWNTSNPAAAPANGLGTFGQYLASGDGGGSWNNSSGFNAIQVNGTQVPVGTPEPGSLFLMGSALIAAGLGFRKRR